MLKAAFVALAGVARHRLTQIRADRGPAAAVQAMTRETLGGEDGFS